MCLGLLKCRRLRFDINVFGIKPDSTAVENNQVGFFQVLIGAREGRVNNILSPIFGQYGLNVQEFCHKFNEQTHKFVVGLPLRVGVRVLLGKKFEFWLHGVVSSVLVGRQIYDNNYFGGIRCLFIFQFFKIVYVFLRGLICFRNIQQINVLLGTVRSFHISSIVFNGCFKKM